MIMKFVIGIAFILWGLYGVIKKRMVAPWALRAKGRYEIEAAKNIPFLAKPEVKNYLIYGAWAVFEGVVLIVAGVIYLLFF